MNQRNQRAKQMMESSGYASQFEFGKFKVRSQTNPEKFYIVSKTDNGLVCECLDHMKSREYHDPPRGALSSHPYQDKLG